MEPANVQIGQVIRVGRGWIEVIVDRKVRRVRARPDLPIRVGCHLQILKGQPVALLPVPQTSGKSLQ